jgi:hypothetical protein
MKPMAYLENIMIEIWIFPQPFYFRSGGLNGHEVSPLFRPLMSVVCSSRLANYVRLPSSSRPDRDLFIKSNKIYWK